MGSDMESPTEVLPRRIQERGGVVHINHRKATSGRLIPQVLAVWAEWISEQAPQTDLELHKSVMGKARRFQEMVIGTGLLVAVVGYILICTLWLSVDSEFHCQDFCGRLCDVRTGVAEPYEPNIVWRFPADMAGNDTEVYRELGGEVHHVIAPAGRDLSLNSRCDPNFTIPLAARGVQECTTMVAAHPECGPMYSVVAGDPITCECQNKSHPCTPQPYLGSVLYELMGSRVRYTRLGTDQYCDNADAILLGQDVASADDCLALRNKNQRCSNTFAYNTRECICLPRPPGAAGEPECEFIPLTGAGVYLYFPALEDSVRVAQAMTSSTAVNRTEAGLRGCVLPYFNTTTDYTGGPEWWNYSLTPQEVDLFDFEITIVLGFLFQPAWWEKSQGTDTVLFEVVTQGILPNGDVIEKTTVVATSCSPGWTYCSPTILLRTPVGDKRGVWRFKVAINWSTLRRPLGRALRPTKPLPESVTLATYTMRRYYIMLACVIRSLLLGTWLWFFGAFLLRLRDAKTRHVLPEQVWLLVVMALMFFYVNPMYIPGLYLRYDYQTVFAAFELFFPRLLHNAVYPFLLIKLIHVASLPRNQSRKGLLWLYYIDLDIGMAPCRALRTIFLPQILAWGFFFAFTTADVIDFANNPVLYPTYPDRTRTGWVYPMVSRTMYMMEAILISIWSFLFLVCLYVAYVKLSNAPYFLYRYCKLSLREMGVFVFARLVPFGIVRVYIAMKEIGVMGEESRVLRVLRQDFTPWNPSLPNVFIDCILLFLTARINLPLKPKDIMPKVKQKQLSNLDVGTVCMVSEDALAVRMAQLELFNDDKCPVPIDIDGSVAHSGREGRITCVESGAVEVTFSGSSLWFAPELLKESAERALLRWMWWILLHGKSMMFFVTEHQKRLFNLLACSCEVAGREQPLFCLESAMTAFGISYDIYFDNHYSEGAASHCARQAFPYRIQPWCRSQAAVAAALAVLPRRSVSFMSWGVRSRSTPVAHVFRSRVHQVETLWSHGVGRPGAWAQAPPLCICSELPEGQVFRVLPARAWLLLLDILPDDSRSKLAFTCKGLRNIVSNPSMYHKGQELDDGVLASSVDREELDAAREAAESLAGTRKPRFTEPIFEDMPQVPNLRDLTHMDPSFLSTSVGMSSDPYHEPDSPLDITIPRDFFYADAPAVIGGVGGALVVVSVCTMEFMLDWVRFVDRKRRISEFNVEAIIETSNNPWSAKPARCQSLLKTEFGGAFVCISRIVFYHEGSEVSVATATASNPNGDSPQGFSAPEALNPSLDTSWLDRNCRSLVVDFGKPTKIDAYAFYTGHQIPSHSRRSDPIGLQLGQQNDPVNWTLEGSNSSGSSKWQVVHSQGVKPQCPYSHHLNDHTLLPCSCSTCAKSLPVGSKCVLCFGCGFAACATCPSKDPPCRCERPPNVVEISCQHCSEVPPRGATLVACRSCAKAFCKECTKVEEYRTPAERSTCIPPISLRDSSTTGLGSAAEVCVSAGFRYYRFTATRVRGWPGCRFPHVSNMVVPNNKALLLSEPSRRSPMHYGEYLDKHHYPVCVCEHVGKCPPQKHWSCCGSLRRDASCITLGCVVLAFRGTIVNDGPCMGENVVTDLDLVQAEVDEMLGPTDEAKDWINELELRAKERTDNRYWRKMRGSHVFDYLSRGVMWGGFQAVGKPRAHRGFLKAWAAMRKQVLDAVTRVCPVCDPRPLVVTGHSLGGALATLAAYDIARELYRGNKEITMYNFGSPRVGDWNFVGLYNLAVPDSYRVVNEDDPVGACPLEFFGMYTHVGTEVKLTEEGEIVIDPTAFESWLSLTTLLKATFCIRNCKFGAHITLQRAGEETIQQIVDGTYESNLQKVAQSCKWFHVGTRSSPAVAWNTQGGLRRRRTVAEDTVPLLSQPVLTPSPRR